MSRIIDHLPNEVLLRIFDNLNLESTLSAGLTCRRWLNILKPVFVHLTDVILVFEDDYCQSSTGVKVQRPSFMHCEQTTTNAITVDENGGSGTLTVNLCACPQHLPMHRHTVDSILMVSGRFIKKLVVEDYLLQKGCFVDIDILIAFAKKCPKLDVIQLHHVDLSRISERELLEAFRLPRLTELFFVQCSWSSWKESSMNRALKSILSCASQLQEIRITGCPLLNDATLQTMAKSCLRLWFIDFSGCRSITANGLSHFFYHMPKRLSDLLYVKICNTRIDGNKLQYLLYSEQHIGRYGSVYPHLINDRQWAVGNFIMDTGHRACSFQNRYVPNKSLIIFL